MNTVAQEAAREAMVQKIASATTTVAAGTAVVGGYAAQELLAVGGFLIALSGFIVNWYYNHKRLKLQERQQDGDDGR
ncbi:holin [Microbulbifer sp. DLAB2-AF]|uniref:Phage holin family protein n=1 Tax=Microbulbifer variabilis TaxID=266805 RepID=A0ABY4VD42_9GAMM|nr:holin [Microbulbifer variabilis]USD22139.1 phage holin family protein [Microbulbifer variabilis]